MCLFRIKIKINILCSRKSPVNTGLKTQTEESLESPLTWIFHYQVIFFVLVRRETAMQAHPWGSDQRRAEPKIPQSPLLPPVRDTEQLQPKVPPNCRGDHLGKERDKHSQASTTSCIFKMFFHVAIFEQRSVIRCDRCRSRCSCLRSYDAGVARVFSYVKMLRL